MRSGGGKWYVDLVLSTAWCGVGWLYVCWKLLCEVYWVIFVLDGCNVMKEILIVGVTDIDHLYDGGPLLRLQHWHSVGTQPSCVLHLPDPHCL